MIIPQGSINATALVVPDLYVVIIPPSVTLLNGVPTNIIGNVGTASWGPVNAPVVCSDMASYARSFGPIMARKYDLGTAVAVETLQGANAFVCVRVTDGTDVAATAILQDTSNATGVTLTGRYTGSLANSITATVANGSKANTFKVTFVLPGQVPEVFDNIAGTGLALWTAIAAAINNGNSVTRGPSQFFTASAGSSVIAPKLASVTASGGSDGATTITSSILVGANTGNRTGMYALAGTGASIGVLADADDSTQWANQVAFGTANGIYMQLVCPAGQVGATGAASAATAKATAGIDDYSFKLYMGDWIYFSDTVNNVTRLVSPQGFGAGRLANLSPEQSSLNKRMYGIVGTQSGALNITYADADLVSLVNAGIELITNPCPGGNYFGCRIGQNGSSNSAINGDEYTRLTNYIAATLNAGMGPYVGELQTVQERLDAQTAIQSFLTNMWDQEMIGDVNNPTQAPFSVVISAANNPTSQVVTGVQVATVQVKYLSVVRKFLINFQGGQTVQIAVQPA